MKKTGPLFYFLFLATLLAHGQETKQWTEADRQYLIDNLTRSRDELIKETKDLTKDQWTHFVSLEATPYCSSDRGDPAALCT